MQSVRDDPKRRSGRPAAGRHPVVSIRLPAEPWGQITDWASKQEDTFSLASAIRRLVEIGLRSGAKRPPSGRCSAQAQELARCTIDNLAQDLGSIVGSGQGRLAKPEELRTIRKDRLRNRST